MALTDTRLRNLRPTGKRFELPDRDGLSLRVSQRGTMTWSVTFRVHGAGESAGIRVQNLAGEKRRLTLGEYPALSLAEAREKAVNAKRLARTGTLPVQIGIASRTSAPTVQELFEKYHVEQLKRNLRSGMNVALLIRRHLLPVWGDRELESITRNDLVNLLEDVRVSQKVEIADDRGRLLNASRGGPGFAGEVRKWATAMFQFDVDCGLLATNPTAGVRNRDKQVRRDHVLTMDELRAVSRAAGNPGAVHSKDPVLWGQSNRWLTQP